MSLAERVGFEPTQEFPLSRLVGVRLKPLGHRSSVGMIHTASRDVYPQLESTLSFDPGDQADPIFDGEKTRDVLHDAHCGDFFCSGAFGFSLDYIKAQFGVL